MEGGRILYTGHRFTDVQTLRHGVFIWDAASGETRCLLEQDRYLVKLFALWRDQAVLCLTDGLGYGNGENGDFYTIPLSGGEPELLLRHSHHCVGNTVATDSRLGAGETWRVCGDTLYFLSTVDRDSRIEALDLTSGEARPSPGRAVWSIWMPRQTGWCTWRFGKTGSERSTLWSMAGRSV